MSKFGKYHAVAFPILEDGPDASTGDAMVGGIGVTIAAALADLVVELERLLHDNPDYCARQPLELEITVEHEDHHSPKRIS